MASKSRGFHLTAEYTGWSISADLPTRMFSQLAEQLRWDSLRTGRISPSEWSAIKAYVAICSTDKSEQTQVKISLMRGSANPVSRLYNPSTLQRLELFAHSSCYRFTGICPQHCEKIELKWVGPEVEPGLPLPLLPLRLPVKESSIQPKSRSDSLPLTLIVSKQSQRALKELSEESLKLGAELGGCLIGHMPNIDTIVIREVLYASKEATSVEQFKFEPYFWLNANSYIADIGLHIFGWHHSHLCDSGYPASLSNLDLTVFHNHFAAPWSVAALVCASSNGPEIKWFGWQDGNVVAIETTQEQRTVNSVIREISCRHQQ